MTSDLSEFVQDIVRVDTEAAFTAQLLVQVEILSLLRSKGLIEPSDITSFVGRVETTSASHSGTSIGHFASLAALLIGQALSARSAPQN